MQKSKKNFCYRKVNEEIRETTEIKRWRQSINIDEEIIKGKKRCLINLINKMTAKEKELISKVFMKRKDT